MIKQREGSYYVALGIFNQIKVRHHFPIELLNKNPLGYVVYGIIWIIYKENEAFIRVPFAKNRLWFKAMASEPEFYAVSKLPQIYLN